MNHLKLRRKMNILIACLLSVVLLGSGHKAYSFNGPIFDQGAGYEQGGYSQYSEQPTDFNWSRHTRFNGVNSNLNEKWNYTANTHTFMQTPIIDQDGTIFVGTDNLLGDSALLALHSDGTVKWQSPLKYKANSSPVISQDGYVYITSGGLLYGFDRETGSSKWLQNGISLNNSALYEIAIGQDGLLYIANVNNILCVNPTTPSIVWSKNLGHRAAYPSIDKNGFIYVQSEAQKTVQLTSLNKNGDIRWTGTYGSNSNNQNLHFSSPLLDDLGNVYIAGSQTKELYSINTSTGVLNWKLPLNGYIYSNPAYNAEEQILYVGTSSSTSTLYAIHVDGTIQWTAAVGGSGIQTSPIIDSKGDIFITAGSSVIVFSQSGIKIAEYDVSPYTNSYNISIGSDGTLYLVNTNKKIYAIGGETILPEAPVNYGLIAQYFNNDNLTELKLTRIDPNINFDWGYGSPHESIDPGTYSVRWSGHIQPSFSDTYTFHAWVDDGVRLWINGELVIDHWQLHDDLEELTGTISLTANQKYDFVMEYFNGPTHGRAELYWSSAEMQNYELIPETAFSH